ncbi:unnamed protein product [Rotaria sp. Silwood1]|nr:unnamed protein product [Rotaria sp. Silwood1]
MTDDCQFTLTPDGTSNLTLTSGNFPPGTNPTQALSDVTAILSLTTPNNEHCNFPYNYSLGNWPMYFCQRHFNASYTCPTTSGRPGLCATGKFANIQASGIDVFDQTYVTDVKQSTSTTQCLDFYYYIPGTSNNPKIQVEWKADEDTQQIIELTPLPENKWHNSRSSFTAPSSSSYQLTLRMMRDGTSTTHYFGLDEIKLYDQSCESIVTTTTSIASTTIIQTETTTLFTDITTLMPTTTVISDTTTPILTTILVLSDTTTPLPSTITSVLPDITTPVLPDTITSVPTTIPASSDRITTVRTAMTSITMTVSATSGSPQSPVVTQGTEETQSTTVSTVTMTTSTSTTEEPLIRLFNCDFSASSCFANSELLIRNGSEFTSVDIISEPPRFPLSDVTSISEPTDNNENCDIPYRPLIDNSTNTTSWDLNFCYMNQCPTKNQVLANCTLDMTEPPTSPTTTSVTTTSQSPAATTTTTTTTTAEPPPPPPSNNLGLILGLSLGLGIPALLSVIGGVVYFIKKTKARPKVVAQNSEVTAEIPMTSRANADKP